MRPLWQRALREDHTYTIYDDIGRLGLEGSDAVGSQSLACMSCHDASQAPSVTGLTYDHPFGVPYRGLPKTAARGERQGDGEAPARAAKHLTGSGSFRPAARGVVENRSVWWVPTGGGGIQRGRNDLPLFSRRGGAEDTAYIECGSCHDPHGNNKLFLRVPNEGSRLCLSCHDV
jgi:predicted CXXCH cytochrome family protein